MLPDPRKAPLPRTNHRLSMVSLVLGLTMLSCLAATAARASDRDLRAITIPATACQEVARSLGTGAIAGPYQGGPFGWTLIAPANRPSSLSLVCPLQVSGVRTTATSGAVRMTSFRILYADNDAQNQNVGLSVLLLKTKKSVGAVALTYQTVCQWSSDTDGTESKLWVSSIKACSHTFEVGAFYEFQVNLYASSPSLSGRVDFGGISFP